MSLEDVLAKAVKGCLLKPRDENGQTIMRGVSLMDATSSSGPWGINALSKAIASELLSTVSKATPPGVDFERATDLILPDELPDSEPEDIAQDFEGLYYEEVILESAEDELHEELPSLQNSDEG